MYTDTYPALQNRAEEFHGPKSPQGQPIRPTLGAKPWQPLIFFCPCSFAFSRMAESESNYIYMCLLKENDKRILKKAIHNVPTQ